MNGDLRRNSCVVVTGHRQARRLSRNLAFIANLMESKINFVCCDNPHANNLTIHVLAAGR
jgi:hypothetical protein